MGSPAGIRVDCGTSRGRVVRILGSRAAYVPHRPHAQKIFLQSYCGANRATGTSTKGIVTAAPGWPCLRGLRSSPASQDTGARKREKAVIMKLFWSVVVVSLSARRGHRGKASGPSRALSQSTDARMSGFDKNFSGKTGYRLHRFHSLLEDGRRNVSLVVVTVGVGQICTL